MAVASGSVVCVYVSEPAAFVSIEPERGARETFVLWYESGVGDGVPADLTAFTRIVQSMWLSILREVQSNGTRVTITHRPQSAHVLALELGG